MNGEEPTGTGSALHTTQHPLPCTRKRPLSSRFHSCRLI
jgi:hypothetical protein